MPVVKLTGSLRVVALVITSIVLSTHGRAESPELSSLRAKAEKGNPIAQYNLGLAYTKGGDVPVNLPQAFAWLSLAAEGGPTSTELDLLRKRMTEEQLAQGRLLLAQRHGATNPKPETLSAIPSAAREKVVIAPAPAGTEASPRSAAVPSASTPGEVDTLRADRKQLSDELAAAWKELEKNRSDSQVNEARLAALKIQLHDAEARLAAAPAVIQVAPAVPSPGENALSTQVTGLQAQLEKAVQAATDLTAKNQSLTLLVADRSRAANESAAALATARQTLADFESQKGHDDEILSRVTAENQSLRSTNADLSTRASTAEAALARAGNPSGDSGRLMRQLDEANQRRDAATRALVPLQAENEKLRASSAVELGEISALKGQVATLQHELATDQEKAAQANAAPPSDPEAGAKLDSAIRSYRLAEEDLEKSKSEAARLTTEKNGLEAELAEARKAAPLAAQAVALREQLRLTQAQATALADENFRLKTDRAMTVSSPSRPKISLPASPVGATASKPPQVDSKLETGAAAKAEPRTHVIAVGDTLTRISMLYYGTPNRWTEVLAANRDVVRDEHALVIGRVLRIPPQ